MASSHPTEYDQKCPCNFYIAEQERICPGLSYVPSFLWTETQTHQYPRCNVADENHILLKGRETRWKEHGSINNHGEQRWAISQNLALSEILYGIKINLFSLHCCCILGSLLHSKHLICGLVIRQWEVILEFGNQTLFMLCQNIW